ncbi:MAG: IPT/TIG domain-containing protein [Deltaproteobacteria bacterium]|nr:IPT/TIG domain-containing protein [Deltaproteobacteria bacterium]
MLGLVCVLVAALASSSMAAVITLNPDDESNSYGYMHTRVLEDANGNLHLLTKLDSDVEDGWGQDDMLVYYMTDSEGNILIDKTFLTVGRRAGRAEMAPVDPTWASTEIAILYHQRIGEIQLAVIDPYLHPMDGTDANATATTPAADGGNTGDGSIAEVWPGMLSAPTEDWDVEFDGTDWGVTGSVSGELDSRADTNAWYPYDAESSSGSFLDGDPVAFYVSSSGDAFVNGDKFTFSVTASPILVQATKDPFSDDGDAFRDVHGQFVHMPSGDLGVLWRYGDTYDEGADQAIVGRFGDFSKSFGSTVTLSETPSAGGYADYGAGDFQVAIAGDYLDLAYTIVPDYMGGSDDNAVELLSYERLNAETFDPLVARTHVFIQDYATRRSFVNLPDGNVLIAFQSYVDGTSLTDTYTMVFNPAAGGLSGDTLTPDVEADADGGNTGNGTMTDVFTSLTTPTANWTVTCTDTSGPVLWSVETEEDSYEEAESDVWYFTDSGAVSFLIESGGTDFVVGDTFTFSTTASTAVVSGPTPVDDGQVMHHPRLYMNPDGRGILMAVLHRDDDNAGRNQPYYAIYGYDGAQIEEPTQAANIDNDGDGDYMEWPYDMGGSMSHDQVILMWNESDGVTGGLHHQLFLDDIPVDAPIVTAVTPGELDDAAGGDIAITGENFVDGAAVFVGDTEIASVTFTDSENLTATVPAGIGEGTYAVRVVNPDTLFGTLDDALTIVTSGDDDDSDDDAGDDDATGDDDAGDDDAADGGGGDDDDDDGGCCGC